MPTYCVNTNVQDNGDHEVHDITSKKDCHPAPSNQHYLGYHFDCSSAVTAANATAFSPANGCASCAPACHTS